MSFLRRLRWIGSTFSSGRDCQQLKVDSNGIKPNPNQEKYLCEVWSTKVVFERIMVKGQTEEGTHDQRTLLSMAYRHSYITLLSNTTVTYPEIPVP